MFLNPPQILIINSFDSTAEKGLLSDIKTSTVLGGFPIGISSSWNFEFDSKKQVDDKIIQVIKCFNNFKISALKYGHVNSSEFIRAIAEQAALFKGVNFIANPVFVNRHHINLVNTECIDLFISKILPLTDLLIINMNELRLLSNRNIDSQNEIVSACNRIFNWGVDKILVTGENFKHSSTITDWLCIKGREADPLSQPYIKTHNIIGVGDMLSTAIAHWLGGGHSLRDSIIKSQAYLNHCLVNSYSAGKFISCPNHIAPLLSSLGTKISAEHEDELARECGIIGSSYIIKKLIKTATILAPSQIPVLITGETGTGKGLFANYLHKLSGRVQEKFISVNCAAIPENLLESLLFGHKKGAFTGAVNDQKGQFIMADKGTLFLDEIGDLPFAAQAKLLKVIESGMVDVLGASPQKVDVRIITATNQDIPKLISEKKFREDLYYRINTGIIKLPTLAERVEDIPQISEYLLAKVNQTIATPRYFTPAAIQTLMQHNWAGNIRQLANVIESSVRLSAHRMLDVEDLLIEVKHHDNSLASLNQFQANFLIDLNKYIAEVRDECISKAVELANGNYSKAARLIGVSPQAISKHIALKKKSTT